jgi:hypothetical protein
VAFESRDREVIEIEPVVISSSSRSLRAAAVVSGAGGFGTGGGGSAVAVQSGVSRVRRAGPARGAASPASIFLHRLKGGVVRFESLRQGVLGLRKHIVGWWRVATSRGSRRSTFRVQKFVIPLGNSSNSEASGFSHRCPEAAWASRSSRNPLRRAFVACEQSWFKAVGAVEAVAVPKNNKQAAQHRPSRRTADALSTVSGKITGVAVSQLGWLLRPAA